MTMNLSAQDFLLFHNYIKEACGIEIPQSKTYLIENRLAKLLAEHNIKSYIELYYKLCDSAKNRGLVHKFLDAITIKETHWFRDKSPWTIMEDTLIPAYLKEFADKKRSKVRIWSAACSTGQEPYSIAMTIDNYLSRQNNNEVQLFDFEIFATDISGEALQYAKTGRYDNVSMERGLSDLYSSKYLRQEGQAWLVNEKIRNAVEFQQFNLKESFFLLGKFDIIFCRYVAIYFSEEFRKQLFNKLAQVLTPQGVLFLGNSELFPDCKTCFTQEKYQGTTYYRNNLTRT